jgi:hypothetical protein
MNWLLLFAACENFSCYEKGLITALDLIAAALECNGDEEGEVSQDPILSDPHFQEIKRLSRMDRRITKVHLRLTELWAYIALLV